MENKYIVTSILDKEYIWIFPGIMDHKRYFEMIRDSARFNELLCPVYVGPEVTLVSAGFVDFREDSVQCHGHSYSLDVGSRPEEDSKLAELTHYG